MKQLIGHDIGSATFNPAARTVTFSGLTLTQEQILLVTNTTDGVLLYNFADAALGGVLTGNVLTLACDTTAMSAEDALQVYVDLPQPAPAREATAEAILAKLPTSPATEATVAEIAAGIGQATVMALTWTGISATSSALVLNPPARFQNATNPFSLRFTGVFDGAMVWLETRAAGSSEWVEHHNETDTTSSAAGVVYLTYGDSVRIGVSGAVATTAVDARIV